VTEHTEWLEAQLTAARAVVEAARVVLKKAYLKDVRLFQDLIDAVNALDALDSKAPKAAT